MTDLLQLKKEIALYYKQHNIVEKSELDWLFCHVLECTKAELFLKKQISGAQARKIKKYAKKRAQGMPLDKIIKQAYFYKLPFYVNNDVLTPRKETEHLIEAVIEQCKPKQNLNILDLGTGSGIIAITLQKELKNAKITASDVSKKALKVAKYNAKRHGVSIHFVKSNLFDKLKRKQFDVIVSNPPYIKSSEITSLQNEVKNYDPMLALDGGFTGLNLYKKIIRCMPKSLKSGGLLCFEVGQGQAQVLKKMLSKQFENIQIIKDYNKIERVVIATKK
jgi:release factor glutamine methyltransferase